MKYPYIIFYRLEKHSNIDNFFIENHEKLNCSLFFTSDKEDLNKLFDSNYQFFLFLHLHITPIIKLKEHTIV